MMHGSLLECGADGKAMNMFQVLQKLEQAEIHTGPPGHWDLVSVFLEIQMVLQYT